MSRGRPLFQGQMADEGLHLPSPSLREAASAPAATTFCVVLRLRAGQEGAHPLALSLDLFIRTPCRSQSSAADDGIRSRQFRQKRNLLKGVRHLHPPGGPEGLAVWSEAAPR